MFDARSSGLWTSKETLMRVFREGLGSTIPESHQENTQSQQLAFKR
jgi:hypothetical protein